MWIISLLYNCMVRSLFCAFHPWLTAILVGGDVVGWPSGFFSFGPSLCFLSVHLSCFSRVVAACDAYAPAVRPRRQTDRVFLCLVHSCLMRMSVRPAAVWTRECSVVITRSTSEWTRRFSEWKYASAYFSTVGRKFAAVVGDIERCPRWPKFNIESRACPLRVDEEWTSRDKASCSSPRRIREVLPKLCWCARCLFLFAFSCIFLQFSGVHWEPSPLLWFSSDIINCANWYISPLYFVLYWQFDYVRILYPRHRLMNWDTALAHATICTKFS